MEVAMATPRDVDRAVAAARKAYDKGPWPRMSARERARIMYKYVDVLEVRGLMGLRESGGFEGGGSAKGW